MTVDSGVLLNLFILLVCVWLSMIINTRFLRPAILNKKRFRLYEIRDKLTILAMKEVVSENSEEYITLLRLMNNSLYSTKKFRITKFLSLHAKLIADKKLEKHLSNILDKIKNDQMPIEYQQLVSEYFEVAHEIYEHKAWTLRVTITPLIWFVSIFAKVIKMAKRLTIILENKRQIINDIKSDFETNIIRFSPPAQVAA